ncbi:hypothetical protein SAMN04488008_102664 [Maribacter orientalis]|uniref:GIY-YIG domain-containing protein n=1 Tax=Maribacter orientalis TaxID=228957 RepID=A0A1H7LZF8_9FLAO|nr:hypothetical protein [Maribacter orientalis]SEL03697.1 hypothetical protein SAMN04488008_102664 [Maribacter orientalis]
MNLTEELRHSIIERLQLTEKLAKKTNLELSDKEFLIERKELQQENSKKLESRIKSSFNNSEDGIVYTIELLDCNQYQEVKKHFENAKKEKKDGRKYSKVNTENIACKYLYVGSSKGKNLATRMRSHFGLGGKSVYSMHLFYSFPKDVDCKFKISLYKVDMPNQEKNPINLLELYEQELWNQCKPMFGKQSGLL